MPCALPESAQGPKHSHMPGNYSLATVEVRTNDRAKPKKVRISAKVRDACELLVNQGLHRSKAAKAVGLQDNSLYRAMRKPEVKALIMSLERDFRTSEGRRSVAKIATLRDKADSEHVQFKSAEWLAGLEGIAPVSRTEHSHIHAHQMIAPGLNISFSAKGDDDLIEGELVDCHMIPDQTTEQEKASNTKGIVQSIPHPALRNGTPDDE